jgi:divalent metal cation (Fe/Co/Zn/Cd) transporter
MDLVIEVDAQISTSEAHEIADQVEEMLADQFNAQDASIHVEPHTDKGTSRPLTVPLSLKHRGRAKSGKLRLVED